MLISAVRPSCLPEALLNAQGDTWPHKPPCNLYVSCHMHWLGKLSHLESVQHVHVIPFGSCQQDAWEALLASAMSGSICTASALFGQPAGACVPYSIGAVLKIRPKPKTQCCITRQPSANAGLGDDPPARMICIIRGAMLQTAMEVEKEQQVMDAEAKKMEAAEEKDADLDAPVMHRVLYVPQVVPACIPGTYLYLCCCRLEI